MRIKPLQLKLEDKVYLKNNFRDFHIKKEDLRFQGQLAIVTSLNLVYDEPGEKPKGFFMCRMCDNTHRIKTAYLPLICIDRSQPLIRNGKKQTLIKKELYIRMQS